MQSAVSCVSLSDFHNCFGSVPKKLRASLQIKVLDFVIFDRSLQL